MEKNTQNIKNDTTSKNQNESWKLLSTGTAKQFVESLCHEALNHEAANHRYLKMIAGGEFPNMKAVLRDYAFQYSFYSREFPNYVEGVIGSLVQEKHREAILENLEEEKGIPGSTDLAKMPHVQLFGVFRKAIGVNEEYVKNTKPCVTALVWRDLFLQKCQSRQVGVSIGALGIATEFIVPTVYGYLLEGIKKTDLKPDDYFFFTLHADCDTHHAEDINHILVDLAEDLDSRETIRFGVHSALNLRKAFWDVMLARAMEIGKSAHV